MKFRPDFSFVGRAVDRYTGPLHARLAALLQPWLAPAQARWQTLSLRDQRALQLMAGALALALLWILLAVPAMNYADGARRELQAARADLLWMQANATRARQATAVGSLPPGQTLLAVVNTDARQVGLNLQRFEPDGAYRVRVTLENAVFTDVLRWLVGMERRYGVQVEHLQAEVQAQPGVANIRLTLAVEP